MSQAPDMRAGDGDRDHTLTLIREAFAEGRLTNDEFQQRMAKAQESKTYGELAALVSDLPVQPPVPATIPTPVPASVAVPVVEEEDHSLRAGWLSWLGVSVLVNVIWGATVLTNSGEFIYYWPIWVMGPWGAVMLFRTITAPRH